MPDMRKDSPHSSSLIYSIDDILSFESDYVSWMDHFYALYPQQVTPDQEEAQKGPGGTDTKAHSEDLWQSLCETYGPEHCINLIAEGFETTKNAMRQGYKVIYQGCLQTKADGSTIEARIPVLLRVDDPERRTSFGLYHYGLSDAEQKLSDPQQNTIVLAAYADMLYQIQGVYPHVLPLFNNAEAKLNQRITDGMYVFQELKKRFLELHNTFDPQNCPDPALTTQHGRWSQHAQQQLRSQESIAQVAFIRLPQIEKLYQKNIKTMRQLVDAAWSADMGIESESFARLQQQCQQQIRSQELGRLSFEPLANPSLSSDKLPPEAPSDIFLDIECLCPGKPELGTLWTWLVVDPDNQSYTQLLAFRAKDLSAACKSFRNAVAAQKKADPTFHIYYFSDRVVQILQALGETYKEFASYLDTLVNEQIFVDLLALVRNYLCIGTEDYTLKTLAPLYNHVERSEASLKHASAAAFEAYLRVHSNDPKVREWLETMRTSQEDRCFSTFALTQWLRTKFAPMLAEAPKVIRQVIRVGEDQGLGKLQTDLRTRKEPIYGLMADLLEYHEREMKVLQREYRQRLQYSDPQELWDDPECLAYLSFLERPKDTNLYIYSFDPNQDVKLDQESTMAVWQYQDIKLKVKEVNLVEGRLILESSKRDLSRHRTLHLIKVPSDYGRSLSEGVRDTAEAFRGNHPPLAFERFLKRTPPVLTSGALPKSETVDIEHIYSVIRSLHYSSVIIQGPPGTGKTVTASKVIARLLNEPAENFRIGILSNSHAAIDNLFFASLKAYEAVTGRALEPSQCVRIAGPDPEDSRITFFEKEHLFSTRSDKGSWPRLIASTAFTFSKKTFEKEIDLLFIDEASQVSLANLAAVAQSCQSFVLLGDQMQLANPSRASHPGQSGESCLDYYLDGRATIPPELGIFLKTSYRMHPDICRVISEHVYEGRLQYARATEHHAIYRAASDTQEWKPGIHFVPVHHQGCTTSSTEEIEAIKSLLDRLLHGTSYSLTPEGSPRDITERDIVIVAPFNVQVNKLKQTIGERYQDLLIGTVDKLQGQEAAVVILSMTASSLEEAPRGIDFILDINRLNVALSRAKIMALVVGNPNLARGKVRTAEQMRQLNFFCRVVQSVVGGVEKGETAA